MKPLHSSAVSRKLRGNGYLKISRVGMCLSACVLFTLASVGCGSGNLRRHSPPWLATAHPLVAQYSIRHVHQGLTAWVEFGTDTTYGRQTSVMTNSATTPGGQTLNILVAGMKPQTTYHMRAHVDWAGGSFVDQDQTFTTGALPASQAVAANPDHSPCRPGPCACSRRGIAEPGSLPDRPCWRRWYGPSGQCHLVLPYRGVPDQN